MLHVALGVVIGRERAEGIVNDAAGLLPSSVHGWRGTAWSNIIVRFQDSEAPSLEGFKTLGKDSKP